MENRKLVSWRLEKLEKKQQDTINAWLNAQQNIQLSLTNVVQHMIDRYGITDIMNYDVQKLLYTNPDSVINKVPVKKDDEPIQVDTKITQKYDETLVSANDGKADLYEALADDL